MISHSINILEKKIRAIVVKEYIEAAGISSVVCYTCGNSSRYLREAGVDVEEVINPDKWYEFNEIAYKHGKFDATSGHLPYPLMLSIANELKAKLGENFHYVYDDGVLELPTGSGETMLCMKLAYPELNIKPIYNLDDTTSYCDMAPLNGIIKMLSYESKR